MPTFSEHWQPIYQILQKFTKFNTFQLFFFASKATFVTEYAIMLGIYADVYDF